jgi:hypothetical protein
LAILPLAMPENHEQEAAKLGFDVTKQFITIAISGIAFVVGLSFSTPTAISSILLWCTIGVFGLSAIFGLLFLMHGVKILGVQKSYDVYATSLRFLAIVQIALVLLGVILVFPILNSRPQLPAKGNNVEIKMTNGQSLSYPVEADKSYTIEIDGTKLKVSTSKP